MTHAGSGSILTSLHHGKVPIVMPRRVALHEHVDDHQVELAERMAELGNCLLAESVDEVIDHVNAYDEAAAGAGRLASAQRSLADTLADVLASYAG